MTQLPLRFPSPILEPIAEDVAQDPYAGWERRAICEAWRRGEVRIEHPLFVDVPRVLETTIPGARRPPLTPGA